MTAFLIILGKIISAISRLLGKGNGSTWPGHIALSLDPYFIQHVQRNSSVKIILIAGTNGKTTTAKMIETILTANGKKVLQNKSGANLLNGIASAMLLAVDSTGHIDAEFAVFEVDENVLPLLIAQITPFAVIALNLFRDQLDRYGELNSIAGKWRKALCALSEKTLVLLNADDPQVAYLGHNITAHVLYFGLDEKGVLHMQHAADSLYCPQCSHKLTYTRIYYSHLGIWQCFACGLTRPTPLLGMEYFPLLGTYNKYNTLAATLVCEQLGISRIDIEKGLRLVKPAFGRQEIMELKNKKIQIFLAKNPTSFNQSLETIQKEGAKKILIILNDRIPDGRDVSWIWDVDFEVFGKNFQEIVLSGDRVYDLALRIQYASIIASSSLHIYTNLHQAIQKSTEMTEDDETLYILPTYSAMLETRQILTGKKIL